MMKKFYVTGMVSVVKSASGIERESKQEFDRVVYAENAEAARDMVIESVKQKRTRKSSWYEVVGFSVLTIEVFESVLMEAAG